MAGQNSIVLPIVILGILLQLFTISLGTAVVLAGNISVKESLLLIPNNTESMVITINGTPNATIVQPSNPTLRESFAAEELQKYIRKISGATLPIKSDAKILSGNITRTNNSNNTKIVSETLIIIGGPERNLKTAELISQDDFDALVPGPEGMMIKSFGTNALVLAGSSKNVFEYERGTLYAVYEFLEMYLGCSFGAYGIPGMEIGEYVPKNIFSKSEAIEKGTIKTGAINYSKRRSDNSYRTAILQYHNTTIPPDHKLNIPFIDWAAKNRYNRILTMESIYTAFKKNGMYEEAKQRGILFTVGHHESSRFFLPPDGNSFFKEKYYTTHPEYYRLKSDGRRLHNTTAWRDSWIFCSRNRNTIEQFADNIKQWLAQNPYVDTVCIWPNDLFAPQCVDPLCAPYSKCENYAWFVNEVAKKVKTGYPGVKIDMLVYSDLFNYPQGVKLDPAVLIDESTWSNKGLRSVGKADGNSLIGTHYEINAKKWHDSGATVVFYEYFMGNFGAKQKYLPMADEMNAVFRYFKNTGYYQGSGTQIEVFNVWNCLFNFYTHGRTSYDVSVSFDKHLDRFCKIFGRGAPFIKSYIQYVESVIDGQVTYDQAGNYLAKNADRAKIYQYFERAYSAELQERLRNNIRLMRMSFRYTDLSTNGGGDAELRYMYDNFDSYKHNPGYGIYIALTGENGLYQPDKWYLFH